MKLCLPNAACTRPMSWNPSGPMVPTPSLPIQVKRPGADPFMEAVIILTVLCGCVKSTTALALLYGYCRSSS